MGKVRVREGKPIKGGGSLKGKTELVTFIFSKVKMR